MKSHAYYLNRYKPKKNNISFFICKIFFYFKNMFFLIKADKLNNDILIISNLVSKKKIDLNDFYFSHFIKFLKRKNKKYDIVYRNIPKIKINSSKKNIYFTSLNRNIFFDIYYFFLILLEINTIYFSLIFKKKTKYENKFIKDSLSFNNIFSSLSNIVEVNKIINYIKIRRPKKIFFTMEGYAWEKMLCYRIRKIDKKIKIYGYYFSIISKYQFFPFVQIGKKFQPNYILTSGNIAKKKFKNCGYDDSRVINIGSNKNLKKINNNHKKKNCLILPEVSKEELYYLIDFALKISIKIPDLKFILRLHPSMNTKLLRNYLKIRVLNSNIILSNNDINNDLNKCFFAIYRSSGSIIEAGINGLYPVYLKKSNELSIDPLYELKNKKLDVYNEIQFQKIYNKIRSSRNYYSKKLKKISNYCKNYYMKPNFKNMNSLILND
ncbi:MAG: hypothetical protein CMG74_04915 [Candidatus Marinimicrobia bacterium]|nr:hypothetical protein [Candidatus Neomarinimicrobiota bacterium]